MARATAGEARGLDVRELAQRLLEHLPPEQGGDAPAPAVSCQALLRDAAKDQHDVPGLFLATLFLVSTEGRLVACLTGS